MVLATLRGVSFTYAYTDEPALRDIDLTLEEGLLYAVIGPNASGKTTLCALLRGIVPHFHEGELTGSVQIRGRDLLDWEPADLSREIGCVFENPFTQISGIKETVFEEIALGLEHARPEFEDTKSLGRGALVHRRQPSSFSARGAIKKPARLVGERVGNVSLSDDDQPISPRRRVKMVVVIVMVALVMPGVVCGGNTRRVKPKARFGIPFDHFRSDAMCRGHSLWPKFRDESGPRRERHI